MNKELIEEMASDMNFACVELSKEQRIEIARTLINLGYYRIPEGSVVLQQKDLTKLQNTITQSCNSRLDVDAVNYLTDTIQEQEQEQEQEQKLKQAGKEIVKGILNRLYGQINETDPQWFSAQIKIIAKKYGVKVEE